MNQIKYVVAFFLCLNIFLPGCIHSSDDDVVIHEAPGEDEPYDDIYEESTSQFDVIRDFETRYKIHSTMLSRRFLAAFSNRYNKLFNEPQPVLEEASQKTSFFVSLYTANRELLDLSDDQTWNIQLKRSGVLSKPSLVKRIHQKERWTPFFKSINPWSREYILVFDEPPASGKGLVENVNTQLIISNADGRVTMSWD